MKILTPVVTTKFLSDHLNNDELVIIDIRKSDEYNSGHIPGSINIPFPAWSVRRDGLDLEMPDDNDLSCLLSYAGLTADSGVIIVNSAAGVYPLADACRTADTLIYAGIDNVSILDQGYEQWVKENRPVSSEPVKPAATSFRVSPDMSMVVNMSYVKDRIGDSVLIDARNPEVYFGIVLEASSSRPGHIPGAKCLPAQWLWTSEGAYRDKEQYKEIAENILENKADKEIIIYCGVGGFTSAWWYVFTRILKYKNVKFYNGSAQDWAKDPQNSLIMYKWE